MAEQFSVKTEIFFLLVLGATAAVLIFPRLDDQILWQDEAETASIARTIFHYGIPKAFDGRNFFSQNAGVDYTETYVWRWHPWLPYYVVAASFSVFGETTFAARLPTALLGVATIILVYIVGRMMFQKRRVALIATLLLLLSVPFLLLSRQCRWYLFSIFFSTLSLLAYANMKEGKKRSGLFFVLATTFLCYSNFVHFVTLLITVALHTLAFYRQNIRKLFVPLFVTFIINLPWLLWFAGTGYNDPTSYSLSTRISQFGEEYLTNVGLFMLSPHLIVTLLLFGVGVWWNDIFVALARCSPRLKTGGLLIFSIAVAGCSLWFSSLYPVVVLAVLLGSLMISFLWKHNSASGVTLLLFFVTVNLAVLVLIVPTPYFRYLAPLFPVVAMLIAVMIDQGVRQHSILGSLVLIVALLPTRLTAEYLYEITHHYDGPMDGIVQYLQNHGTENDTVLITYSDITLAFYTKMKIVGGLTGEDPEPYTNPNWIIVRKYPMGLADSALRRHIQTQIPWEKYQRITLPFPDTRFQNREDPRYHHFRTQSGEDSVRIFQRTQ